VITRRTILKAVGAVAMAPLAFLWPKRAEGLVCYSYSRAYANPPVKMTTWWELENGELAWNFFAIEGHAGEGFWEVRRIFSSKVAHYCEWGEVLNETQLEMLENHPDPSWLIGNTVTPLIRYIPGAKMGPMRHGRPVITEEMGRNMKSPFRRSEPDL